MPEKRARIIIFDNEEYEQLVRLFLQQNVEGGNFSFESPARTEDGYGYTEKDAIAHIEELAEKPVAPDNSEKIIFIVRSNLGTWDGYLTGENGKNIAKSIRKFLPYAKVILLKEFADHSATDVTDKEIDRRDLELLPEAIQKLL